MRFKIGTKFVALIAALLLVAVVSVSWITSQPFLEDNRTLVLEMNLEGASRISSASRSAILGVSERGRSFINSLLDAGSVSERAVAAQFFEKNSKYLAAFLLPENSGSEADAVAELAAVSPTLESEGKTSADLLRVVLRAASSSLPAILRGEVQLGFLSLGADRSVLWMGFPLRRGGQAAFLLVETSQFGEAFEDAAGIAGYLVTRDGILLAKSPDLAWKASENLSTREIVRHALGSKIGNGQLRFVDPESHESRLGVFRALGLADLTVITEVPESRAFEASRRAQNRTALFAVVVLCLSLLIGFYFSDSLTYPIAQLVEAARRIGAGDFAVNVDVQSRDELAQLSVAFNDMARGLEERDRVKNVFNKFHNKEIAEQLLNGTVKLGGERRQVVVLFSDIRNFTSMSETMEPEQVVEMLNEYMSEMVAVIRAHGGIVDKFVGDAIMALWGVPEAGTRDAEQAVAAALGMREALTRLNERRAARGLDPLRIGIGLNAGPVIAGNIGSNEKMEYTVIGDTVNLASRIESLTKELGRDLLISHSVAEAVKDAFILEDSVDASVKGKSMAISVFGVKSRREVAKVPLPPRPPRIPSKKAA